MRSSKLAGNSGTRKFLMRFAADETVDSVEFVQPSGGRHPNRDELDANGVSYLFYDPLYAPIYTWIGWNKVTRPSMERLLQAPFEAGDFVQFPHVAARAGALEPSGDFPESHGVMFF